MAAELERTAAKATARSGYAAAAAAYQRVVQLTTDPAAQARRLTLAAEAALETGELDQARRLATQAAGQTREPAVQASVAGVQAWVDFAHGRLVRAHRLLVDSAAMLGERVQPQAARMLMHAMQIPTGWCATTSPRV